MASQLVVSLGCLDAQGLALLLRPAHLLLQRGDAGHRRNALFPTVLLQLLHTRLEGGMRRLRDSEQLLRLGLRC